MLIKMRMMTTTLMIMLMPMLMVMILFCRQMKESLKLKRLSDEAYVAQSVEILAALKKLGEQARSACTLVAPTPHHQDQVQRLVMFLC
jgi:hypothetical protein